MSALRTTAILIGLGALAAIAAGFATLNIIPYYATERTVGAIAARTGLQPNVLRHSGLRFAESDVVPRDNPDTLTSFAYYDLADGPLRFTGSIPQERVYWSVSLFAQNTDNYFVLNDRNAASLQPKVVIAARGSGYSPAADELLALSPSRKGVLIVRLTAPDRNDEAMVQALNAVLAKASLTPAAP